MAETETDPELKSLAALEWPRLWDALSEKILSPPGAEAAARFVFLDDLGAIRESLNRIAEMGRLWQRRGELSFEGVSQAGPSLERAEKGGRLTIAELVAVANTQRAAVALAAALDADPELPGLLALAGELRPEHALCRRLGDAITAKGELSERTFPRLGELRREIAARREEIHRRLDAMLRSRGLRNALQERIVSVRGNRYVLPVKADFRGQVPGIVHDLSATGATLFVEPQSVVEESNALTLAEKQREAAVDAILAELSRAVGDCAQPLRANLAWLGRVDLLQAQAALAQAYGGSAPRVEAEGRIALRDVANPLMLLNGERPVQNDLSLEPPTRCMVISGANTGGKTVLLKSVGLCALLVRAGMPIPAGEGSRCDFFPNVRADIGDRQDLVRSLSTFSAQIVFMAEALQLLAEPKKEPAEAMRRPGGATLVLVDEILTGTAPQEGAALAATLLEALADSGGACIVTTHYSELKELAAGHPAMVNASVSFDPQNLRPTYHLLATTAGASYAFPIARRHGLPGHLVARAEQALAGRPAAAEALLAEVQLSERKLRTRAEAAGRREEELARLAGTLESREGALADREARVRRKERGALSAEFEQARRKIGAVIERLRGANSLPLAGKVRQRLEDVKQEAMQPFHDPPPPLEPVEPASLRPGDAVMLRSLGQVGQLIELPARGGRAKVSLGAISMEVELAELALPPPAEVGAGKKGARAGQPGRSGGGQNSATPPPATRRQGPGGDEVAGESGKIRSVLPTSENTLDLRGLRLEEALGLSEQFFDRCVMKTVTPVVLIHGHGTGKLKAGLRRKLRESDYVAAFRPGERGEGWDGVTVVALNL